MMLLFFLILLFVLLLLLGVCVCVGEQYMLEHRQLEDMWDMNNECICYSGLGHLSAIQMFTILTERESLGFLNN